MSRTNDRQTIHGRIITRRTVAVICIALLVCVAIPSLAGSGSIATKVHQTPRSGHNVSDRVVAITFDDGPSPTYTPRILRILSRRHAKASFLMTGSEASAHPMLVKRVARAGHGIGGHTWNHVDLRGLSATEFSREVDRTNALLARLPDPDRMIRCVRPPYGAYDSTVVARLGERHIRTTMWSIDPQDWRRPGTNSIVSNVLSNLSPGAIVLLHDGGGDRSQTVAALPAIIRGIRDRGYDLVTICRR
jgi:peptidoglycan/xylan/chitin deacetylase (PgdA/CDA1 family)